MQKELLRNRSQSKSRFQKNTQTSKNRSYFNKTKFSLKKFYIKSLELLSKLKLVFILSITLYIFEAFKLRELFHEISLFKMQSISLLS